MTFVDVDQQAFADGSREAVIDSVDPELRPIVEGLFSN